MIFGVGTDIIEVDRIRRIVDNSDAFIKKIYTKNEYNYCIGKGKGRYQSFAGRYAAKEAVFKALGTGYRDGFKFSEIEIINDDLGKPYVETSGKVKEFIAKHGIQNIHISLTHVEANAVAFAVAEK